VALACILAPVSLAQTPRPAITLDPPTDLDLAAHIMDSKGNLLPEGPANFRRLGEATVGELADLHTLTLRFNTNTKLTGIKSSPDFTLEQGSSCVEGNFYASGTTCTLLVRFTPKGAGRRLGRLTIGHTASAQPTPFALSGYSYSPVIDFIPSIITTVAGTYPANVGLLNGAHNLSIDGGDTLYVADTGNNAIRFLDSSGLFTSYASTAAGPYGIAADSFGEIWYSAPASNVIHEIYAYSDIDFQANGAGTDACTNPSTCALNAELVRQPGAISISASDNMYFEESTRGAAFTSNTLSSPTLTRMYDPFTYQSGSPTAFAVDAGGNLYSSWTSAGNCTIAYQSLYNAETLAAIYSKVAGGRVCGYSGDGGLARNAEISTSLGQFAFDAAGNFYFTDTGNKRVRKIEAATGIIHTIAGNGTAGYTGDGGSAAGATLANPTGVAVDSQGQVFIISATSAAATTQVIRKVGTTGVASYGNQIINTPSPTHIVTVSNNGNSQMTLTSATLTGAFPTQFSIDPTTTSCVLASGAYLNQGSSCNIGIIFKPTAAGAKTAILRLLDNTVYGTNDISLSGTGILPSATFTITSPTAGSTITFGTAVTFAASVTSVSGPAPTGSVQFKVDGANYGSPVTIASGKASTSVVGLTKAPHSLSATYSGDANYAPGGPVSVAITVAVKVGIAKVVLTPLLVGRLGPIEKQGGDALPLCGSTLTFAVTVSAASSPTPTGSVKLMEGSRVISVGELKNAATTLTAWMGLGTHLVTAHYDGDAEHLPANSAVLKEVVNGTPACGTAL
jgi:sugar lactone lactonase YvrE